MSIRQTIRSQFDAVWKADPDNPVTVVTYDNENFDPKEYDEWVRFVVLQTDGSQDTLGPHRFRREGIVVVQVFVLCGSGMVRMDELTDKARKIFEGENFTLANGGSGLYLNVKIRDLGVQEKWFVSNVEANYRQWESI